VSSPDFLRVETHLPAAQFAFGPGDLTEASLGCTLGYNQIWGSAVLPSPTETKTPSLSLSTKKEG
jgi:hypothetical protein